MAEAAHAGGYLLTVGGRRVGVAAPRPEEIAIGDVAHGLALANRFAGHTAEPYSVAEHSVLVVRLVRELLPAADDRTLRRALLHDAAEAYLGDLVTPAKALAPDYRVLEARMMAAICVRFDLPHAAGPEVKLADRYALATERRDLFPAAERRLRVDGAPAAWAIRPVGWRRAEEAFLECWRDLGGEP